MKPYKQPVSALVLIYSPDLQVLMMERADKADYWQSVTGSIENNETPREAAIREVQEETGLNALAYELQDWQLSHVYEIYPHWRHRYAPGITHNTEHQFGLCVPRDVPIKLAPNEHVRYEWVSMQVALQRVFSWTNVNAIKHLALIHKINL